MKRWIVVALLFVLPLAGLQAQEAAVPTNAPAMVIFHGQELFRLQPISSVSAEVRKGTLLRRLKRAAKSPVINTDQFSIYHDDTLNVSAIMAQQDIILGVWEVDAEMHGIPRKELAEHWLKIIQDVIDQYRRDYTTENYVKGAVFTAITTVVFLIVLWQISKLFKKEIKLAEARFAGKQMLKFLDGESIIAINGYLMKFIRFVIIGAAFIIYLNFVLGLFPWTFNLSARLFEMVSDPFIKFGRGFVNNLPKLITLAVIIFITHYVLKSLKHVFNQIAEGKVRIRGFYQDWAETTFTLIKVVVIVFAAVIAWPNIPGSDSTAFKGISIFMGVLVSLGSSSAVGNIFGSLMLTYMRSFQPGDFVEINGQQGTVMSRRTFSTRLKTRTNEVISIPNALVAANHIINFSRMTKSIGVNMGTAVTIGYATPWRTVHELLLKSAEGVPDVLDDPPPTVLQLGLDDFYVKYKLVISTKNPAGKFRILSNLHQNIQDNFAAAGVEIMSPHYQANRTGEAIAIPDDIDDSPDGEGG